MTCERMGTFHIGLDDTDSPDGMCTTYLTYKIVQRLEKQKLTRLIDYPNLIRLNPSIPWKTRGNGALVVRIESELRAKEVFAICASLVNKFATSDQANSGLIIFEGEVIPREIYDFAKNALWSYQSLSVAKSIIRRMDLQHLFRGNGQGLVGALAGIGNELRGDYTYELIAYRKNCSKPRQVDENKVREMDLKTRPWTFNCYDSMNSKVLICPHGPDPVLLGIRGESPGAVREAFNLVQPGTNLLGYMIFRSNQGTGEHLRNFLDLSKVQAYTCGRLVGQVASSPEICKGGHVYFELRGENGRIKCAAYEPTGSFRKIVLSLVPGDYVEVAGSIRRASKNYPRILNLEFLIPRKLVQIRIKSQCVGNMLIDWNDLRRTPHEGKIYLPDMKAQRHLTKPLQRYENVRARKKALSIEEPMNFIITKNR